MTDLPERTVLRPSPRRLLVLALISLGFLVLGLWLGHEKGDWRMYACAAFFSLGLLAAPLMAVSKVGQVVLNREGMEMKGAFSTVRVPWSQVEWLGILSMRGNKMPSYRLKAEHRGRGNQLARSMSGVDGSLANLYRESPDQVLELMKRYSAWEPGKDMGPKRVKIGEAKRR